MAVIDSSKVDNINNVQNKTSTSKAQNAMNSLSGDFQNFLKLLTTQLKNQDPTAPLDTNQFTQQIASLSAVEQAIQTNSNLEKLISMGTSGQVNNLVGYIGKRVDAEGNKSTLENGVASFVYDLPQAAESVDLIIMNNKGTVVYKGAGTFDKGRNEVFWDGTNSFDTTKTEPDGIYSIEVKAKDAAGKDITATTYTTGRVSAVNMENGKVTLDIGEMTMELEDVIRVREDVLARN